MQYIYNFINKKTKIIINSPKPEELNTSEDIRAILLYEFPELRNDYFIVSNVHDNFAVLVGDNIICKGKVIIQIKKNNQLLKGENKHATTCWDYTIE
ncbi:hypothetical protein [Spiroplasma endosymbiont of Polydrusus pterygomalis]|uniref:hypothetical protein n=1 Tax=Spiroplasma endosymbiont of Polydrusus pterygomalis TaxID=3139327 RepID=UPI003CCB7150